MDFNTYLTSYWKYYLLLERDYIKTTDYVEPIQNNFSTTSNIFAKLILTIGSEIDNVFREVSSLSGRTTISDYYNPVMLAFPHIQNKTIIVNDTDIILQPFSAWNEHEPARSLSFWNAYNELKHDRVNNAQNASMKNAIEALSALFLLEMLRMDNIFQNDPETFANMPQDDNSQSSVFVVDDWSLKLRISKLKMDYSLYDEEHGKYDYKKEK